MRSFYLKDTRLQRGERRRCLQGDSVSCHLFFGYFKEAIPVVLSRESSREMQGCTIFLDPDQQIVIQFHLGQPGVSEKRLCPWKNRLEIVKNKSENWDWYLDSTEVFI